MPGPAEHGLREAGKEGGYRSRGLARSVEERVWLAGIQPGVKESPAAHTSWADDKWMSKGTAPEPLASNKTKVNVDRPLLMGLCMPHLSSRLITG